MVKSTHQFKIGDKVRILSVGAISCGNGVWCNGDITQVVDFFEGDKKQPRLKATVPGVDVDALYIDTSEYHAVELVEQSNAQTFEFDGQTLTLSPEQLTGAARKLQSAADKARKEAQKPKLKVGDWVRAIGDGEGITDGKAYEVFDNTTPGFVRVVDDYGNKTGVPYGDFEIIDELTPFDRAGRKPNEFKKGDIVRVVDAMGGNNMVGDLVEVYLTDGTDTPKVVDRDGDAVWEKAELVTPVESRVDIAEGADVA